MDGFSKIDVGLHVDVDVGNERHGGSTEAKEEHDVEGEPRQEADHPGPFQGSCSTGEDYQAVH